MPTLSRGMEVDGFKRGHQNIKCIFSDLMRMKTNLHNFFLPPNILQEVPSTLPKPASRVDKIASELIDCCPFCDYSRYESFLGYSEFSEPCIKPLECSFDPITGISVVPPFCLPFSLNPNDGGFIDNYIYKHALLNLLSYSINCTDCSQVFHIECARRNSSTNAVIPLIYSRDRDNKGNREPFELVFPNAIICLRTQQCFDCLFSGSNDIQKTAVASSVEKPANNLQEKCSRCWRDFQLSHLVAVQARLLYVNKNIKENQSYSELICSSCLECSHCLSSGDDDPYCSTSILGLPKKQQSLPWVVFWIYSAPPLSLLFCGGCASAMDAKEYCPICFQLYDRDNFSIPMAKCDDCNRWIHVGCDPSIDLSWYASASNGNGALQYTCPCCVRGKSVCLSNENKSEISSTLPNHSCSFYSSGTWILSHGVVPYSPTPHIPGKWIKSLESGKWPVELVVARFVPSFRSLRKKTLLLIKVLRGWEPAGQSPRLEIRFLDHTENGSPCAFKLDSLNDWKSLYIDLWLTWVGYCSPFSRIHCLSFILGESVLQCLRSASFISCNTPSSSKCTRAIPGIKRKNNLGFGQLRHAVNGTCNNEMVSSISLNYFDRNYSSVNSLSIHRSSIQGLGVYAKVSIEANVPLLPYYGVIVGPHLAENLESLYESLGLGCYFFKISSTLIIDATLGGSSARFVNHSCDPNCVTKSICSAKASFSYKLKKGGITCTNSCRPSCSIVVIYSKRDINPGEELTYDYMFKLEGDHSLRIPCGCRSPKCRGFMN